MQATPFARLNLTGYACQTELQVSFAVGNVAGLSEFSPTITIKIKSDNSKFVCMLVSVYVFCQAHIVNTYTFYTPHSQSYGGREGHWYSGPSHREVPKVRRRCSTAAGRRG